jgi:anthranilate phosphoribosyltransferase
MKEVLNRLFQHERLDEDSAREILLKISKNEYNSSQIAAFITVYLMRGITPEELKGFQKALIDLCIKVDFDGFDTIDVCGTGGDGKNTFNISTISAFIIAAAGYKVAKHGNYGVSSVAGSSSVLEELGIKFHNDISKLKRDMDKFGLVFMHAPLFHPALKTVGPIRKEIGVKTFFNMLGPLVNPSQPTHQLTGVFNLKLTRMYQSLMQGSHKAYGIVYGLDGYDEISLTSDVKLITNDYETTLTPSELGYQKVNPIDITGGHTVQDAAKIFLEVLTCNGSTAQNAVVCANTALAITIIDSTKKYDDALALANDTLKSKAPLNLFKSMINE